GRIGGQFLEIAAVDEVYALANAEASRVPVDVAAPVEQRRVERMRLDQEVSIFICVAGEALHHIPSGRAHVRERGVATDLVVAGQLQRKEEEGLAFKGLNDLVRLATTQAADEILPAPAHGFHQG